MRTRVPSALLVMVLMLGAAGRARGDDQASAKALYKEGMLQYNVGEYEKALDKFKSAYLVHPDPAFLFNIGQCQRQLGQWDAAAKSYRTFLRESPTLPQRSRDEVQKLIGEMDDAVREQRAKAPPTGTQPPQEPGGAPTTPPMEPAPTPTPTPRAQVTPPPAPPSPPPRPWYKNPLGMALAGGGIVIAAVGAGLLGKAGGDESSARNAATLQEQQSLHDGAKGLQSGGIALIAVGAAATVAGVVVLAVGARHKSATVEARR